MNIEELLRNELLEVRRKEVEKTNVLSMFSRLMELLPQKLGVTKTCENLVRIIIEETDFENCSIALWNPAERCLAFVAGYGLPDLLDEDIGRAYHRALTFDTGHDIAGGVYTGQEPVFIGDAREHPIPPKSRAVVSPVSLVCVPLLDLGILNMSASHPRKFTPEQRRSWVLLGSIIGQLITTASLHERLSDTNQLLEQDVDRKTRELEARNQELVLMNELLERIIDHSREGICLLDSDGIIRKMNRGMAKFQGEEAHEAIGSSPSVFFDDPLAFRNLLNEVSEAGSRQALDLFMRTPEGELLPVDIYLTRLSDKQEATSGYLLVVYDMAEKKAFSEQLLRTEKLAALGTMAGGVAHDFNNMLMRILGNTQLLMLHVSDETIRSRLKNIDSAVQDAAQTLKRLQTFAGKNGEAQGHASAVNVKEVLDDVVELTRPRWKNSLEKHGFTIDLGLDAASDCVVRVSASDLREALANIILNAVDAMPTGGGLTIRTGCQGESVWIEVSDTGLGMPEEVIRRVFDPFFSTKGVGNSGLGLSVAWNLITRHGGNIEVTSQPGQGSTFRIWLPRAQDEAKLTSTIRVSPEAMSGRVLLVDDDQEILRLLRDMIRMSGHRVTATADAEEAMELIEKEEFDLVVSDMGMPVVSGWEIAKKVKNRSPLVPVILITGWGTQYEEEDLTRHGIDLVLSKPLGYEKLKAILQKYL